MKRRKAFPAGRLLFPVFLGLFLLSPAFVFSSGQKKVNPKDLGPQYQDWIKLTTYIIRDKERDVFLSLLNDRDRDLFIEAFWKMRDPTPGTPENEFKQEIIKRFQDANKKFRRRSSREGWMTDQGRIYIILGPPKSTEDIAGSSDLYPCEIWSYYGDVNKNMPTHFQLMFFQWRNVGEFKLYDPLSDGPSKLLINSIEMDQSDYQAMYQKIFDLQPDIAAICLSIIPGEIPFAFRPSPENTIMMANILESPKKLVDDTYATHFMNYRGVVSTEYLTNYMECETSVAVVRDPLTGLAFIDFAMAPKRLSLNLYEPKDEFSAGFQVDVSLRAGDKVIYQYSKDFSVTIPGKDLTDFENMGVCLTDSFPAIEGKYKLSVLLRNTVGKEFSVLESDLEVPAAPLRPRLGRPVLGYKISDAQPGVHVPFQAENKKLSVDPKATFSASDSISYFFNVDGLTGELSEGGTVGVSVKGAKPDNPFQKSFVIPLRAQGFHKTIVVTQTLAAAEFPPDYYQMTLTLKDPNGTPLDEQRATFILSPQKTVAHPVIASKATALANSFIFYYMLAHQYDQANEVVKAEAMYRTAAGMNPSFLQKIPEYADFLLKIRRFEETLGLVEKIKDDKNLRFQYDLIKGRALMGLERYPEALLCLAEGNRIYNSDTGLLNALGRCYFKMGKTQDAVDVLSSSLRLNPDQPETRALLREIESKKK